MTMMSRSVSPSSDGDPDLPVGSPAADVSADELSRFVETMGLGLESSGLPRAAGRMLAWLMVCDPPEQSADQLAEALLASSGGVSTNVRMLVQLQLVERVGQAGSRRSLYRVAPSAWDHAMKAQERPTSRLRELADVGLHLLAETDPARRRRLHEMHDYLAFMEREMPALRRRYHEERGRADEHV